MSAAREFDDPLDDILSAPIHTPASQPVPPVKVPAAEMHFESCSKCGGSGVYGHFGKCFACNGKGGRHYKQTFAVRAANRMQAQDRKDRKFEAFLATPEGAYLKAQAYRDKPWQFAVELLDKVRKYGDLTDAQLAAVQRSMARNAERKAQWAAEKAQKQAPVVLDEGRLQALQAAFAKAQTANVEHVKLRLDAFVFSASQNRPGEIFVRERAGEQTYLGKIQDGQFHRRRECSDEQANAIVLAALDPEKAAKAYGQKFGSCSVCGRMLTDQASIAAGIGPVCAERFGWGA